MLFDTWRRLLAGVSIAVALFGVVMAVASRTALFAAFNTAVDARFFGAVTPAEAVAFRSWAYAAWGATVAGFGVVLAALTLSPWRRRERWARDTVALAVIVWFVPDTAASVLYGVWLNVGLNLALLAVTSLPLAATWREFR